MLPPSRERRSSLGPRSLPWRLATRFFTALFPRGTPFFLSRCRPLGRFRAVSRHGGLLAFARKPRRASFNEKLISRVSRRLLQHQVFILFFAVLRLPVSLRRRHSCPIQPPSFASYLSFPRPKAESTSPLLFSLFALLALFTPPKAPRFPGVSSSVSSSYPPLCNEGTRRMERRWNGATSPASVSFHLARFCVSSCLRCLLRIAAPSIILGGTAARSLINRALRSIS